MYADKVTAHRGACAHAPENTLAAMRVAHETGARWVETDVSLLGDGSPVICHDPTVDRCTDGSGALADLSLAQISSLDAGRWFSGAYVGEPLPTLKQMLDLCLELELGLNLELKVHDGEAPALVETVLNHLYRTDYPLERFLVSSFDHHALALMHQQQSSVATGLLYDSISPGWAALAETCGAVSLHPNFRKLAEEEIRAVRAAGLDLYVYTPNDPAEVAPLWEGGISGVITDEPALFLEALGEGVR
mgnify:CR=1 FL=1